MAKEKVMATKTKGWKPAITASILTFAFFFVYAIVRYVVFRGVAVEQIPLFVNNKALALAATYLIGFSFLLGPLARFWPKTFVPRLYLRKYLGLSGFAIAALHAFISLLLFSPAYYSRFFTESGKLTLIGESSMLFGTFALFIFTIAAITSIPSIEKSLDKKVWLFIQRLGYLAFFLVALHIFVFAWRGWLNPESWSNWMAPMSFLAAIFIAIVLIARLLTLIMPRRK